MKNAKNIVMLATAIDSHITYINRKAHPVEQLLSLEDQSNFESCLMVETWPQGHNYQENELLSQPTQIENNVNNKDRKQIGKPCIKCRK